MQRNFLKYMKMTLIKTSNSEVYGVPTDYLLSPSKASSTGTGLNKQVLSLMFEMTLN